MDRAGPSTSKSGMESGIFRICSNRRRISSPPSLVDKRSTPKAKMYLVRLPNTRTDCAVNPFGERSLFSFFSAVSRMKFDLGDGVPVQHFMEKIDVAVQSVLDSNR